MPTGIAHDASPLTFRKHIGHKSRGKYDETRLADSDQSMANQQLREVVRERCEQRGCAPNQRPHDDDWLSRKSACQGAHKWRSAHVEDKKDAGEHAEGSIAAVEFRLDQILHCEQHGAVDVVQQIQRGQQGQRGAGIKFRGSHRTSEYSMTIATRNQCFDFVLGHFAITTVEIPPRGRKSPFTSAHTGLAQRTTSSRTRFTMFS